VLWWVSAPSNMGVAVAGYCHIVHIVVLILLSAIVPFSVLHRLNKWSSVGETDQGSEKHQSQNY